MRFLFLLLLCLNSFAKDKIVVGSKNFTESYILAEIIAQTIEDAGEVEVERKFGMAGTGIISEALKKNEIDIYPEYTGTISRFFLKKPELNSVDEINNELKKYKLNTSNPLGFNNTYALAIRETFAKKHDLYKISDIKKVKLHAGFSYEFVKRDDGIVPLIKHYGIEFKKIQSFEHSLLYDAVKNNEVDIIEVYSTDGKIPHYNLQILDDDKSYFPQYYSVLFFHENLRKYSDTLKALINLEGRITNKKMQHLNSMADVQKKSFQDIADIFLDKNPTKVSRNKRELGKIVKLTKEHLYLVIVSLFFSVLIGVPLGYLSFKFKKMGQVILIFVGVLQTIPSLALLCFLLPLFGIGTLPALIALFLYSLLPIVRNTYTGLLSLNSSLIESAKVLGLSPKQRLFYIQLPMASRQILAGVKTSGVINVGMTTLAAFVGAGGYGTLIVTGLALNDNGVILQGAIPAALMSVAVHVFFELMEKIIVPKGLRV